MHVKFIFLLPCQLRRADTNHCRSRMETVYFNGGSLISKRSSIIEAAKCGCCRVLETDVDEIEGCSDAKSMGKPPKGGCNYSFQPYAYPRSTLSDWERVMCKATIEYYQ